MPTNDLLIKVKPKRILKILLGLTFLLALLNIAALYLRFFPERYHIYNSLHEFFVDTYINQFTMNNEMNIPTYVSSMQLFFASLLLFAVAAVKKIEQDKYQRHWLGLGFILLAFSIDEFVAFHETLAKLFKTLPDFNGLLSFKWLFAGFAFLLIFGVLYIKFFFQLENKYKFLFLGAAVLYFTGAMGFEIIGGRFANYHDTRNITFYLITTVEEMLEPSGIAVLIYGLLRYLQERMNELRIGIAEG